MPFHVGIGFSHHPQAITAVQEAIKKAKEQLKFDRVDAAILFHTAPYNPKEFLPAIAKALPQTRLVGCMTSEIVTENRFEPVGLSIVLLSSPRLKFESGQVSHLALQDLRAAGKTFVRDCVTGFGQSSRKLLLFFMDGLIDGPENFTDGIREELGKALPIIGVGTSDNYQFQKTYQYHLDQILTGGACGLLWGEKLHIGMSCQHGWKPLGKPRTVTAVRGQTIMTIDDRPAAEIYENLLKDILPGWTPRRLDSTTLRYPLGFRSAPGQEFIVRNVIAKLDDGSIVCQDKVNEGAMVHVLLGNKRSCLQAAEQAAYQVREQLAGVAPQVILVFSSLMRKYLLGRSASQEIKLVHNILGENVPLVGMCSQREIFTTTYLERSAQTDIHNSSLLILAVG